MDIVIYSHKQNKYSEIQNIVTGGYIYDKKTKIWS